jgi:hypothetical protein
LEQLASFDPTNAAPAVAGNPFRLKAEICRLNLSGRIKRAKNHKLPNKKVISLSGNHFVNFVS